jgi:hypothetical protein
MDADDRERSNFPFTYYIAVGLIGIGAVLFAVSVPILLISLSDKVRSDVSASVLGIASGIGMFLTGTILEILLQIEVNTQKRGEE